MKTLARERDKTEILVRLRAVRPESAARWGRMSAHQMVCHVADAIRMALGEQPVTPATGLLQRTIVKWIALYAPLPWPGGRIHTSPEIDQVRLGAKPVDFAADVARVEALLEGFATRSASCDGRAHPVFGRMSEQAWMRWGYLHMDHHLRQFGT